MFEQRIPRPAILLSLSSRDLRADGLMVVRIYGPGGNGRSKRGGVGLHAATTIFLYCIFFGEVSFLGHIGR